MRARWRGRCRRRRRWPAPASCRGATCGRCGSPAAARVGVELDGETLDAGTVVLCAGSWSSMVEGGGVPAPLVRPARGQMVAIETRPPLFRHVLVAFRRGYLVPRSDGVALAGSTLEMVGFRKEVTVAGLHDILSLARALVPELGAAPVVETWSNFRPYTPDGLPIIGRTGDRRAAGRDRTPPLRDPAHAHHRPGDRRAGDEGHHQPGHRRLRRRALCARARFQLACRDRCPTACLADDRCCRGRPLSPWRWRWPRRRARQAPAAPPPAAPAPAAEGAVGQAPIAAGDVATARDRALNEAFRQLVEAAFTGLVAENGGATSPALSSLRAGWLQRPKRLVRSYRVLEQSEDGGLLRVRVTAELDEAFMRREFDRSRGVANRGVAPGVLPVLAVGAPEAGTVLVSALGDQGIRAQLQAGAANDEAALRALAARAGRVGGAGHRPRRQRGPGARHRPAGGGVPRWGCAWSRPTPAPAPSAAPARAASRSRRATPAPPASPGPPAICCRRCCPRSAAGRGPRAICGWSRSTSTSTSRRSSLRCCGPCARSAAPPRPRSAGWWWAGSRCASARAWRRRRCWPD